jgi:DNA repair ATPase RecN
MNQNWISIWLGIVATCGVVFVGAWLKALFSRANKAADIRLDTHDKQFVKLEAAIGSCASFAIVGDKLADLSKKIDTLHAYYASVDTICRNHDRDLARLEEVLKLVDEFKKSIHAIEALRSEFLEKFTRRADFVRELQTLSSQVETVFRMIDRVAEKVDERINRH